MFTLIFGLATFCLVFLCSLLALKQSGLSEIRGPLAVCVAILSTLSLLGGTSASPGVFSWPILLPYAVLAVSLLLVLLLLLLAAVTTSLGRWKDRYDKSPEDPKSNEAPSSSQMDQHSRTGTSSPLVANLKTDESARSTEQGLEDVRRVRVSKNKENKNATSTK